MKIYSGRSGACGKLRHGAKQRQTNHPRKPTDTDSHHRHPGRQCQHVQSVSSYPTDAALQRGLTQALGRVLRLAQQRDKVQHDQNFPPQRTR